MNSQLKIVELLNKLEGTLHADFFYNSIVIIFFNITNGNCLELSEYNFSGIALIVIYVNDELQKRLALASSQVIQL